MENYDLIIVGAGTAGIMAAITAARQGKRCILIERNSVIGSKLSASGGGRCNLSNTLSIENFVSKFDREGKFMLTALRKFGSKELIEFFKELEVECHAPDGLRIFPVTHDSKTVLEALTKELKRLEVRVLLSHRIRKIAKENNLWIADDCFSAEKLLIATGGISFKSLGCEGDGHKFAEKLGHSITDMFPAMLPIETKETWMKSCRADTIGKAVLKINLPKFEKKKCQGDVIFTSDGIRGPVVLDFSREITPLFAKFKEVPLLLNVVQGRNQEEVRKYINDCNKNKALNTIPKILNKLIPEKLCIELCKMAEIDSTTTFKESEGAKKDFFIKLATGIPLTAIGCQGFESAMVTRGGINLKEINPATMESKIISGLYFCGEILNLDGPCGGYNLQWAFTSGFTAGSN